MAVKLPAKAKLLANLSSVSAADRARAGITDEMVKAQAEAQQTKTGIEIVKGPFQVATDQDVETQVRVIDHDSNRVLFSGNEGDYARLKRAIAVERER